MVVPGQRMQEKLNSEKKKMIEDLQPLKGNFYFQNKENVIEKAILSDLPNINGTRQWMLLKSIKDSSWQNSMLQSLHWYDLRTPAAKSARLT